MAEAADPQRMEAAALRQGGEDATGSRVELPGRLQAYREEEEPTGEDLDLKEEDVVDQLEGGEDVAAVRDEEEEVLVEKTGGEEGFAKDEVSAAAAAATDNNKDVDMEQEKGGPGSSEEKKVVKISPPVSSDQRLLQRAKRFNLPTTVPAVQRFNVPTVPAVHRFNVPTVPAVQRFNVPTVPAVERFNLPTTVPAVQRFNVPTVPAVERFSAPSTAASKKAVRAERFGLPLASGRATSQKSPPSSGSPAGGANNNINNNNSGSAPASLDQMKRRVERFGAVSDVLQRAEGDERLRKRKARFAFGSLTAASSEGNAEQAAEAKRRRRVERFGKV